MSSKAVEFEAVHEKKVTEWQLREELERHDVEFVAGELDKLLALVDRETTLLANIWYDQMGRVEAQGISPTLYRWLLHCSIWKRNNGIPNRLWEDFCYKVLEVSDGKSQINERAADGKVSSYTLSLARLTKLRGVCRLVEAMAFYEGARSHKRSRLGNLKPGADASHIQPFSLHGDGLVIPEPAGRNRARGARPIEEPTSSP